jgi:hypothetical protein
LGGKRTVWVLGNTTTTDEWKTVIADLMGISEGEIMTVPLQVAPLPVAPGDAPAVPRAGHLSSRTA